jgi:homoserine O-acetyltransferase
MNYVTLITAAILSMIAVDTRAQTSMIVEKKVFVMPSLRMQGGETVEDVRVGWESYGTLNADKSNAILVTHFFSGTSHAAGKYRESDAVAGYWDPLIGPGRAIDTDRYFVISSDTLVNLNVNSPDVVTTGPASINPDTGKHYGLTFPVVTFRDMIEVQRALIDSLGIGKLKAVVGPSMGALQAFEWAAAYPDRMERIVPVIGAAGSDPFLIAWLDTARSHRTPGSRPRSRSWGSRPTRPNGRARPSAMRPPCRPRRRLQPSTTFSRSRRRSTRAAWPAPRVRTPITCSTW